MTEPVGNRNTGAQIEAMLRDIVDADPGVTARRAPARHETQSIAAAAHDEANLHAFSHLGTHALEHAGLASSAAVFNAAMTVGTPLLALGHVVTDADERGHATRMQMQHDRMRGALAVLEGRIGEDGVRAEMARNPSFADGVRRAENLARTKSPAELRAMVALVRQAGNDGQAAVCLGRDRGAEFNRRYQSDPAFAHGVDFARRQRTDDPAAFEARRVRFEALETQNQAAAASAPIRS